MQGKIFNPGWGYSKPTGQMPTPSKGNARVKGATAVTVDGIRFASKREAGAWQTLVWLQKGGKIADLKRQVPVVLMGRDGPILTPAGRPMRYIADFHYRDTETGAEVWADAKGHPTEVYLMKRAILAQQGVFVMEI